MRLIKEGKTHQTDGRVDVLVWPLKWGAGTLQEVFYAGPTASWALQDE